MARPSNAICVLTVSTEEWLTSIKKSYSDARKRFSMSLIMCFCNRILWPVDIVEIFFFRGC